MVLSWWLAAILAAGSGVDADLSKIERRIGKEPAYPAAPKYCLLVFGPSAEARVWLVTAGDHLYLDRNGNGDLTDPGDKVSTSFTFPAYAKQRPDGAPIETHIRIQRHQSNPRLHIRTPNGRRYYVGTDEADKLTFADRPENAPIVRLDGPMTLRWYGEPPPLRAGNHVELDVSVGTPGLGKGTFAMVCCSSFLDGSPPIADLEFPMRSGGTRSVQVKIPDD